MPKVSVIVPVYKVEQYLHACVDSILAQTFTDFELILVDDGSPDRCGAICDDYVQKDSRVRCIHQENQGLSGARNSGIDVARGEYITFVDSDDVLSPGYLAVLYDSIKAYNADVSCCRMRTFTDGDELTDIAASSGPADIRLLTGREAALSIYQGTGEAGVFAWGKLYRQSLIAKHRFPMGKIHEDQAVVPIVLYEAERIASVDAYGYYYRIRAGSITQKSFKANRFDNVWALDNCIDYFQQKNDRTLFEAAQKTQKKVNAILVLLAESENAHDEIPNEYRLSRMNAVYYLFKYAPDDTFSWYFCKVYPRGQRVSAYMLKIRRMLRTTKR